MAFRIPWTASPELKLKWRYDDIREAQRRRRRRLRRIDYQDVSAEAGKAIDAVRAILKATGRPHSFSSAINRIIALWVRGSVGES
jgi:hypothetical protein